MKTNNRNSFQLRFFCFLTLFLPFTAFANPIGTQFMWGKALLHFLLVLCLVCGIEYFLAKRFLKLKGKTAYSVIFQLNLFTLIVSVFAYYKTPNFLSFFFKPEWSASLYSSISKMIVFFTVGCLCKLIVSAIWNTRQPEKYTYKKLLPSIIVMHIFSFGLIIVLFFTFKPFPKMENLEWTKSADSLKNSEFTFLAFDTENDQVLKLNLTGEKQVVVPYPVSGFICNSSQDVFITTDHQGKLKLWDGINKKEHALPKAMYPNSSNPYINRAALSPSCGLVAYINTEWKKNSNDYYYQLYVYDVAESQLLDTKGSIFEKTGMDDSFNIIWSNQENILYIKKDNWKTKEVKLYKITLKADSVESIEEHDSVTESELGDNYAPFSLRHTSWTGSKEYNKSEADSFGNTSLVFSLGKQSPFKYFYHVGFDMRNMKDVVHRYFTKFSVERDKEILLSYDTRIALSEGYIVDDGKACIIGEGRYLHVVDIENRTIMRYPHEVRCAAIPGKYFRKRKVSFCYDFKKDSEK